MFEDITLLDIIKETYCHHDLFLASLRDLEVGYNARLNKHDYVVSISLISERRDRGVRIKECSNLCFSNAITRLKSTSTRDSLPRLLFKESKGFKTKSE